MPESDESQDRGFVKVFWAKVRPILSECTPSQNKVLDLLVTGGATGKPVDETIETMARALKIDRKTVQRAISFFASKDLIRRGKHRVIYLNPNLIFRGKPHHRSFAVSVYNTLEGPKS